jgi:hypothetical protein
MRVVPARINTTWIGTLTDDDIFSVEARLNDNLWVLEGR